MTLTTRDLAEVARLANLTLSWLVDVADTPPVRVATDPDAKLAAARSEIAARWPAVVDMAGTVAVAADLADAEVDAGRLAADHPAVLAVQSQRRMYAVTLEVGPPDAPAVPPQPNPVDDSHHAVRRLLDGLQPLAQRDDTRAFIEGARAAADALTAETRRSHGEEQL
ncbi:hypothetical protein [Tsukamurella paurometabola]|uniref:Uncharacterized protein n=1 Tax=Tsukamurella paurometabola TaxID=2061 RepID=A0A3P8L6J3_TSUPA|nr:hypothetical protein [Tsukamurella paurometabola]UEA81797.1 hypothetical protein LK411_15565 [Tsukamurella paurometabola]VDR38811.1 Uncharacterised protein [Tsukamurella paurometabola]